MTSLYRAFHFLTLRERLLLLAFLWVALIAWGNYLYQDLQTRWSTQSSLQEAIAIQDFTLDRELEVAQLLDAARQGLDNSKTLNASSLIGRLDSLARTSGLVFDISRPSTQETDLFSFHNVRLGIKQATVEKLIEFDTELRKESPYISLNRFQIRANRRDPRNLDATLEVASFELTAAALE